MINYSNVPPELRQLHLWVNFKLVWNADKNKNDKLPYNPATGQAAKVNDITTWTTFDTAVQAVQRGTYDGIGIMLYGGICGIDIDHCIDSNGTLTAAAADIIETMNSYTEYSPSGSGIHILFCGSIPDKDRRNGSIEMYNTGRYLTVTGNTIGSPALHERTAEAAAVHKKYIQRVPSAQPTQPPQQPRTGIISSSNLLYRMINSAAGAAIRALWDGDYSAYAADGETGHHRADIALCNHLAYWTNGNREQMDSMFRASGLMRDKWNEQRGISTYGQLTINKALEDFTPYTPPKYKIIIGKRKDK